MKYKEVSGDLIALAKAGEFELVAHGCNCFCRMRRGIAPQMAAAFGCDKFPLEQPKYIGEPNKLGQIDFEIIQLTNKKELTVVNCYTQYHWATSINDPVALNYQALELCLLKINKGFRSLKIGIPRIGCGLAGGNWAVVKYLVQNNLKDCDVTVVNYKP